VEAKEGMKIERENQTLATITFQNYFRMYEKLAGMTGTAFTEANEFKGIYQLDVVVIPANKNLIRLSNPDCVYKTEKEKFNAVVEEIVGLYNTGRPVLVGTISIDKSERLSDMLKRRGIQHQVLNAKYHEIEAQIVAQAGRYKAVTIATNMAGRGTDILLGGNPEFMARNVIKQKVPVDDPQYESEYRSLLDKYKEEARQEHAKVVELGGLHVIGTERHEARRIDNQLRGRAGRQGDPGSSRFYVSLEDDLMRLFGSDKLIGIMDKLGLEEGQVIEHPWITRSIEVAQRRVEQHNFEIRKQLLEYDNVMNKQREVIYTQRRQILEGVSLKEEVLDMLSKSLDEIMGVHLSENAGQDWDIEGLLNAVKLKFGIDIRPDVLEGKSREDIKRLLSGELIETYEYKEKKIGPEIMRNLERMVFLQIIDSKWKEHLYSMDSLREGIGLRAYGQRDPLVEYKREAFEMFSQMMAGIEEEASEILFKIQAERPERTRGVFSGMEQRLMHQELSTFEGPAANNEEAFTSTRPPSSVVDTTPKKPQQKVGRNDPCPCGSGKKYKKCCGR